MRLQRLDFVWLALLLATGITWWLGEQGAGGVAAVAAMLTVAGVKCALVILDFMALRKVRAIWPLMLLGWTGVVLALIALLYLRA